MRLFSTLRLFLKLERTKKFNLSLVQSLTFDHPTKVENKQQEEKDIISWPAFPIGESWATTTKSDSRRAQEGGWK
jgi:hypothetical protein